MGQAREIYFTPFQRTSSFQYTHIYMKSFKKKKIGGIFGSQSQSIIK